MSPSGAPSFERQVGTMKQFKNKFLALIVCLAMVVSVFAPVGQVSAAEDAAQEYEIYPIPQQMEYAEGEWELGTNANVVYESGIDEATIARLEETLALQDITIGDEGDEGEEEEKAEVVRISGTTRYETGYGVADRLQQTLRVDLFDAVVVATGKNFADALAGSYLAVEKNAPIILTNGKDDNIAALLSAGVPLVATIALSKSGSFSVKLFVILLNPPVFPMNVPTLV